VAVGLSDHAKEGYVLSPLSRLLLMVSDSYQFIMRNYRSVSLMLYPPYNLKRLSFPAKVTRYPYLGSHGVVSAASSNKEHALFKPISPHRSGRSWYALQGSNPYH
jgi:hypothetical protein